jgi:formate hydrogenlyase subunit 4
LSITYILVAESPNYVVHALISITCQAQHLGTIRTTLERHFMTSTSHVFTIVSLYVYMNIKSAKELMEAIKHKDGAS